MALHVVVTGDPDRGQTLAAALREHGCDVVQMRERNGYMARLAASQPALVIVVAPAANPGAVPATDWRFWIVVAKVNAATRRIPVLVLAEGEAAEEARHSGADDVLPPAAAQELDALLIHARSYDETAQALADQCQEALPAAAHDAIARFNAGDYYRQHDLFEALWMAESRPIRTLYQAILQVGIAYYQIEQGNGRGAHKMLLRAGQWLNPLPDVCQHVLIGQLREQAAVVRAALEACDYDAALVDRALLKPVALAE